MGLEGLVALFPLLFIAVLTLLIRALAARHKNARRPSSSAEAPPSQLQPGSPPELRPETPAPVEQMVQTEFLYPTPIQIKKLHARGERTVEPAEEQEQEGTRGLLAQPFSLPPEKPAAAAHPVGRLTPLQRAVVWAEILGPPKADG